MVTPKLSDSGYMVSRCHMMTLDPSIAQKMGTDVGKIHSRERHLTRFSELTPGVLQEAAF